MDSKNIINSFKEFWKSKSSAVKKTIIFSTVAVIGLMVALVFLYTKDSYEFLLKTTDDEASANVINQLKEQDIKYDVKGDAIYVSDVNPDALRLELAGNGYLNTDNSSLELFSSTLFISEKQEEKLIQKDLENNIAAAIKSYNEVADAKILLTMGNDSSFKNDSIPATAAIQLKLKSSLSKKQISSIQEFVSAAVPNLSAAQVVVTDTNNNLLSNNGNDTSVEDSSAYIVSIEDKTSSEILTLLNVAFPTTNFQVTSKVDVNFDETKIEKETVSSGPDTIISHETNSEITTNEVAGAVVGTEANVPSYETDPNSSNSINEKKSEIINYELNKTKEQITKQPEIVNVNVAVVADKPLSAVDTAKIRELVETASGYNEDRGDKVSVHSFDTVAAKAPTEGDSLLSGDNLKEVIKFAITGVVIIAILIIVLIVVRTLNPKAKKENTDALDTTGINVDFADEGQESVMVVKTESEKKKDIIKQEIENSPKKIASVLQIWLNKELRGKF